RDTMNRDSAADRASGIATMSALGCIARQPPARRGMENELMPKRRALKPPRSGRRIAIVLVLVVIRRKFGAHIAEHNPHDMGLGILKESLRTLQWRPSNFTDLVDQDHAVDFGTDYDGIGDRQDRWTVKHDEIIVFFAGGDQIHETLRVEELRWVGRQMPAGDDTQVVHAGSAQDLIEPQLPEHQIRS